MYIHIVDANPNQNPSIKVLHALSVPFSTFFFVRRRKDKLRVESWVAFGSNGSWLGTCVRFNLYLFGWVRCHMYMHSRTFFGANNVVPQLKDATWDISQTMSRMKSTKLLDEQNAKLKSTMLCTVATYHWWCDDACKKRNANRSKVAQLN